MKWNLVNVTFPSRRVYCCKLASVCKSTSSRNLWSPAVNSAQPCNFAWTQHHYDNWSNLQNSWTIILSRAELTGIAEFRLNRLIYTLTPLWPPLFFYLFIFWSLDHKSVLERKTRPNANLNVWNKTVFLVNKCLLVGTVISLRIKVQSR